MPIGISWSGLNRYEQCHMKHRLVIAKKARKINGRAFLPGTVCDRAMRQWLEDPARQPGGMEKLVPELFHHYAHEDDQYFIKWRHTNDEPCTLNLCLEAVRALEPVLYEHIIPYDVIPELRFKVPVLIPGFYGGQVEIHLLGGIDIAVTRPDGTHHLYDLKITKDPKYLNKTLGQGVLYDIAHSIEKNHRTESFTFILPLTDQKVFPVHYTDDDRNAMMARIINMAHGIFRKDWEPQEGRTGCSTCEVSHACPKYQGQMTVDTKGQKRASLEPTT